MLELNDRQRMYPSDRELVLRSKINIGWSVHSHKVFSRRLESFSDSEIDFILHVISRAEKSELIEQQRIGGLVQRLENVKKNTYENGPQSCSMCGVNFGKQSSIFQCYDCSKSVCNKCCVDTCSVAHDPCMLCKICAEDRELWKKSGGWFYGSLPRCIKTSKKLPVSPNSARWQPIKPEIVSLESFTPSEIDCNCENLRRVSSWLNLAIQTGDRSDEPDSPDALEMTTSSVDNKKSGYLKPINENIRREVSCQYLAAPETNLNLMSMTSLSTSCPSLVPPKISISVPSHENVGMAEFYVSYDSRSHVLRCTIYCVKGMHVKKMEDGEMIYIQVQMIPFLKKVNPLKTKSVKKGSNVAFNETVEFPKIRQDKLKKRMLRLQVLKDDPFDDDLIGDVSVDLTEFKTTQSRFFTLALKENKSEMHRTVGCCGWILLSLRYSPEEHSLVLGVNCCSDLVSSNKSESLISFVRINLMPEFSDTKYDTSVKHKTTNPNFNEEFTFHLSPMEMKNKSLMVSVLEKTGKHNKNLGHVILGIQAKGDMLQHWLEALQKPKINVEKWHALLKERKYGT